DRRLLRCGGRLLPALVETFRRSLHAHIEGLGGALDAEELRGSGGDDRSRLIAIGPHGLVCRRGEESECRDRSARCPARGRRDEAATSGDRVCERYASMLCLARDCFFYPPIRGLEIGVEGLGDAVLLSDVVPQFVGSGLGGPLVFAFQNAADLAQLVVSDG